MSARHQLIITHTFADGHTHQLDVIEYGGDAKTAHQHLAKRWLETGYDYTRDTSALSLTRKHPEREYTETVQHVQVLA